MLVTILCFDKPDHFDLRMKTRPAHLAWLEEKKPRASFIGPIMSDDQKTMHGSVYIAEFDDLAQARAFQQDDPYHRAGLFERVVVQPTRNILAPA